MTRLPLTGAWILLAGLTLAPGVVAQTEPKREASREQARAGKAKEAG